MVAPPARNNLPGFPGDVVPITLRESPGEPAVAVTSRACLAASVASFRRYVAANVPEETRRSQVTVWSSRQAEAGEQAQIDYGMLGRWLDPLTGKLRTVWEFVMVLACSRHMFVC